MEITRIRSDALAATLIEQQFFWRPRIFRWCSSRSRYVNRADDPPSNDDGRQWHVGIMSTFARIFCGLSVADWRHIGVHYTVARTVAGHRYANRGDPDTTGRSAAMSAVRGRQDRTERSAARP